MPIQDPETAALIEEIAAALTGDRGQYREVVGADNPSRVGLVRSSGRAAGRQCRVSVRTFEQLLDDGRHEVFVFSTEPIDPHDELAQRRWQRRLRSVVDAAAAPPK